MRKISRRLFLLLLLSACSPLPSTDRRYLTGPLPTLIPQAKPTYPPGQPTPTTVPVDVPVADTDNQCMAPIVVPARPAVVPADDHVDPVTGRHFMGTLRLLDARSYRLAVSGLVDHPLSLTYDDLRCLPRITETVTTTCYDFADTATWSGVLISEVLKKAGVRPGAQKMRQTAADGAARTVTLEMAMDPHNFLAYLMEGQPLPALFGYPVRSIFIDVAGQFSVKWLTGLEVT